jgi:hypothetical protein
MLIKAMLPIEKAAPKSRVSVLKQNVNTLTLRFYCAMIRRGQ